MVDKKWRVLRQVGTVLGALVGLAILLIGVRLVVEPVTAAAGFGLPRSPLRHNDFLRVKGVRDVVTGLMVWLVLALADTRTAGWFLLLGSLIPLGDAAVVASLGTPMVALMVHLPAAAASLVSGVCLLIARGRLHHEASSANSSDERVDASRAHVGSQTTSSGEGG